MKLTEHFTLEELTFSQTAARHGIRNEPSPEVVKNLHKLASYLEAVREELGVPIRITSGYRSPELNALIPGSSSTSAHTKGLAADINVSSIAPRRLARMIADLQLGFDQIILEYDTWVHVGLSEDKPRNQLLTVRQGTGYMEGIV
jgi:uncharacterized protein YcbK (DUF882 family)